jgi:hypothetical protein
MKVADGDNTLAYYFKELITAAKDFTIQALEPIT